MPDAPMTATRLRALAAAAGVRRAIEADRDLAIAKAEYHADRAVNGDDTISFAAEATLAQAWADLATVHQARLDKFGAA